MPLPGLAPALTVSFFRLAARQAGADIELGASTPLMEAAQEGHLELVR